MIFFMLVSDYVLVDRFLSLDELKVNPNTEKTHCSKIGKKVQFQKHKNTFFAISKMAKNQFLHQKKV